MKINAIIYDQYPDTMIGVLYLKNINNRPNPNTEFFLRESEAYVLDHYGGFDLIKLPEIQKWRDIYKTQGVKKGTRVSIESMVKRVLKGQQIPSINPLVDLYNAVSLRYLFPLGGEDLDKTQGTVELTLATGSESFQQIGSDLNEPPSPGEIIYKDDLGCLCRCWNWREADRTKLTHETKHAILVIESTDPERYEDMKVALKALQDLCEKFLQAETQVEILKKR